MNSLDTRKTLHIRCGSDIRETLKAAGFVGPFLEFSDPLCQGPIKDVPQEEFVNSRAQFLANALKVNQEDILRRLKSEYELLSEIPLFDKAVLWFEHDSYDQIILTYILHRLKASQGLIELSLIAVDSLPGVEPFIGLGQATPSLLQWAWKERKIALQSEHFELADTTWSALSQTNKEPLEKIIASNTPAMPLLAPALSRHLKELPSLQNGLGLTQQLTLEIIKEQGKVAGDIIFRKLTTEKEPLPYLGDSMFWHELELLTNTSKPLLTCDNDSLPWGSRSFTLTETGQKILNNEVNFLTLFQDIKWIGGIQVQGKGNSSTD